MAIAVFISFRIICCLPLVKPGFSFVFK